MIKRKPERLKLALKFLDDDEDWEPDSHFRYVSFMEALIKELKKPKTKKLVIDSSPLCMVGYAVEFRLTESGFKIDTEHGYYEEELLDRTIAYSTYNLLTVYKTEKSDLNKLINFHNYPYREKRKEVSHKTEEIIYFPNKG